MPKKKTFWECKICDATFTEYDEAVTCEMSHAIHRRGWRVLSIVGQNINFKDLQDTKESVPIGIEVRTPDGNVLCYQLIT